MDTRVVAGDGQGVVATFGSYTDARRAADHLARQGFSAAGLTIVGSELRVVQRVVGRWSWWHAAVAGALAGALGGLLLGALLAAATTDVLGTTSVLVWTAVWGIVLGSGLAWFAHTSGGGRRCICSRGRLTPFRFELHADAELVEGARTLLAGPRPPARLPGLR